MVDNAVSVAPTEFVVSDVEVKKNASAVLI